MGHGFLEKVYEKALCKELTLQGLVVETQVPIDVYYKGDIVGEYFADLVVENKVIIELKAQSAITKSHESQVLNYLRASRTKVGLLVNFTYPQATVKRFVY